MSMLGPVARTAAAMAFALMSGCGGCGGGAARIPSPPFDPGTVSGRIFAEGDKNKDGKLDAKEAAALPSIAAALKAWDKNSDGALVPAEVVAQLKQHQESRMPLVQTSCHVVRGGEPLAGAEVRFVPEPFMDQGFRIATGKTDDQGHVSLASEGEPLPGIRCGLYRVEVSKKDESGKETLPAQYNTQTTLGYEVRLGSAQGIRLELK